MLRLPKLTIPIFWILLLLNLVPILLHMSTALFKYSLSSGYPVQTNTVHDVYSEVGRGGYKAGCARQLPPALTDTERALYVPLKKAQCPMPNKLEANNRMEATRNCQQSSQTQGCLAVCAATIECYVGTPCRKPLYHP